MPGAFTIADRPVNADARPLLPDGEVAQAHDGSLGIAHAFVDAIADAGADAVKFQTHIAEAESTPAEDVPRRVRRGRTRPLRLLETKQFNEAGGRARRVTLPNAA